MHTYIRFKVDHQRKSKSYKAGQVVSLIKRVCDELVSAGVAENVTDQDYYQYRDNGQKVEERPYEFNPKE